MWLNDYSGRRTSARSPPTWVCARPRRSARTSSSTRTRCAASSATPRSTADDVVLEVGPGLGSLTLGLLPAARRVVAVELDTVLAQRLPVTVAERAPAFAERLDGRARRRAARHRRCPARRRPPWSRTCRTTSRCPSCCTSWRTFPSLRHGLVMVQAEVADRLTAGPGGKVYGVPSVKMAWYAETRRAGNVGRAVFWPAPNVDSGLVAFTRREAPSPTSRARRSSRSSTRPSRSAARPCGPHWPAGPDRPPPRRRHCAPRTSTPAPAASPSTSRPSPGSRRQRRGFPYDPMTVITVRVPAKVNLELSVGPVRDDGYHDLVNVFHAVSLFDEVTATPAASLSVSVDGPAGVPMGPDNLAARAASLLAAHRGRGAGRRAAHPQGHPGRGRHGRRQRRRGGGAGGVRRAVGHATRPGDAAGARRRAGQRRAVRLARRHGRGPGPGGAADRRSRSRESSTGSSATPPAACPRRPCTPSATGCAPPASRTVAAGLRRPDDGVEDRRRCRAGAGVAERPAVGGAVSLRPDLAEALDGGP